MRKILLILLVGVGLIGCEEDRVVYKSIIDYEYGNNVKMNKNELYESKLFEDSIYLDFGVGYTDDELRISYADRIIDTIISTDQSLGLAESFNIGGRNESKEIFIEINNSLPIQINTLPNRRNIFLITLNKSDAIVYCDWLKNAPWYE
ncbi:MAG: hypothetical protein P8Q14_12295 [Vicingaceae bacterium]|nr:hypothetical protein [Vicingaceae bacterium]